MRRGRNAALQSDTEENYAEEDDKADSFQTDNTDEKNVCECFQDTIKIYSSCAGD